MSRGSWKISQKNNPSVAGFRGRFGAKSSGVMFHLATLSLPAVGRHNTATVWPLSAPLEFDYRATEPTGQAISTQPARRVAPVAWLFLGNVQALSSSINRPPLTEQECSLPWTQERATGHYYEPDESSSNILTPYLRLSLRSSSYPNCTFL